MKLPIIAVVVLATALGGCARLKESPINPLNWFGQARQAAVADLYVRPDDARALVAQVTVAAALSTIKLQGVTSIVVQGAENALSAGR